MKSTSLASLGFDLSGEESDVLFQDTLKMIFLKYVNPILFFYFPLSILKKCAIIILQSAALAENGGKYLVFHSNIGG